VGVNVGFENPVFGSLEMDYEKIDEKPSLPYLIIDLFQCKKTDFTLDDINIFLLALW
jgi:hypothetical protein